MNRGLWLAILWSLSATTLLATDISGPVSGIWDPSGNPYNLVGETWVPFGQSLTILPGTDIDWVWDGIEFHAYGRMEASGLPENQIDMTNGVSYLHLYLHGSGAESDLIENVNLNGKVFLYDADHILNGIDLYFESSSTDWHCGIEGPANNISVLNCEIELYVSNSYPAAVAYANGIYQLNGIIQNCYFDLYARNSGYDLSAADAVGINECDGIFISNEFHLYGSASGTWGNGCEAGFEDCSGVFKQNYIKFGNTAAAKHGIENGNGDAINNTMYFPNSNFGWVRGIEISTGVVMNNVLLCEGWDAEGIVGGSSVTYNTLWGFSEYFSPTIPPASACNRIEYPNFNPVSGFLNLTSPCINHGNPDILYNDPDGSRNDRGWMPFDPGFLANLVASQNAIDFGRVTIGTFSEHTITFVNVGLSVGEITSCQSSNPAYSVINGVPSGPIMPGDSIEVIIRFEPQQGGYWDVDEISFIGVTIPPYHIELSGVGIAELSGNITTPVTLTQPNSPYYMTGGVNVLANGSLMVEPGVEILITGPYHIYAEGTLSACGTETDSIYLVPEIPNIEWYGIDIEEGPGVKELSYCVIEGTIGDPMYNENGAAITVLNEEVTLSHCRFSGNSAQMGAGIYMDNGILRMDSCLLSENSASSLDSSSILCALNSTVELEGNQFTGNSASNGIVFLGETETNTLNGHVISNNNGIGISITGSSIYSFERNLVYGNTDIGVSAVASSTCTFDRCTITENTTGLAVTTIPGGTFTAKNLILYANGSGTQAEQLSITGGTSDITYSDIHGGWIGTGNLDTDPLFVDFSIGDFHLQSEVGSYHDGQWLVDPQTSLCIDAGDPASAYVNETEPNGDRVNMGTYGNTDQASRSLNDPQCVSDSVSGVWTTALNPRYVISDIYILADQTLVIEPGVEVIFMGHYKFEVQTNATLQAMGTEIDSILFTSDNTDTGWYSLRFLNASDSCRLEYCHLTYSIAPDYPDYGGAIYCESSNPTINNCTIDSCSAYNGGAIYCAAHSNPLISNNVIYGNLATNEGGGIYSAIDANPSIAYNYISGNSSEHGGGIYCHGGGVIENNALTDNSATENGGGVYLDQTTASLTNNTLTTNYAEEGGGVYSIFGNSLIADNLISNNSSVCGGGILCHMSSPAITNNLFLYNTASYGGGGIFCNAQSSPEISFCTLMGNITSNKGGGLQIQDNSHPAVSYCSIDENEAERGGGIYIFEDSHPIILYCSISRNWAEERDGGIYVQQDSNPLIRNCTIYGNSAPEGYGGLCAGMGNLATLINSILWNNLPAQLSLDYPGVSYCNIQDSVWSGVGNIDVYPLFVDTTWNDYRLQWGSPCIDTGDPNPLYNDPDGTIADMGAFYYDQSVPVRILLTPHNAPIEIPPEGGSFDYTIQATNIDLNPQTVTAWCDVLLPNSVVYGPVLGPVSMTLLNYMTISRERTQIVPAGAPAGTYTYNAYAVAESDTSMDSFNFMKSGSVGMDALSGWANFGESFEDVGSVGVSPLPDAYTLGQNYPNPFNPVTTIRYGLPEASHVHLVIYDIAGRSVATLIDGHRDAGFHEITFDGSHFSSGIYIYCLKADNFTATGKMVLLK
jgi:parallel beta-helix repeat protein/predicted outer membrane repeat protein